MFSSGYFYVLLNLKFKNIFGPVAHLAERLLCMQEVAGSSPVRSTILLFHKVCIIIIIIV